MKLHVERKVLIGFLITTLVLAVLGVFSFSSMQRLINTARLLSHASRVINNAEQIMKAIVDIETGQRGFVITGHEEFLEPYYESSKRLNKYLSTIDSLTAKNPLQQSKVVELRAFIHHQLEWSKSVIEIRRINFDNARDKVASGEGKRTTDDIRQIVSDIQNEERENFRRGNTISGKNLQQFQYSFLGLAIIITTIIIYLFYVINRTLKRRDDVEKQLKKIADETRDLYDNAPCGYFSVDSSIHFSNINQTLINWLGYTREEVIGKMKYEDLLEPTSKALFLSGFEKDFEQYKNAGYVSDLEFDFQRKNGTTFPVIINSVAIFNNDGDFVKSRSTVMDNSERKKAENKVNLLNQELEAFTYSVSHDLRAPLRSVTGYSQILREDYGNKFDDEGVRIIEIIMNNAKRMGQLIDDLLDFSRLGRKELSHGNVNMDELVRDVTQDLAEQEGKRQLNIRILPLTPSNADNSMIRQVWINLISNALKYSRDKETTEIEIGSYEENGHTCYYIRDNGVGFDMRYVGKLFGVFQRLHKMHEFEGTGVGLALVKTIVGRHGGQVWGEGKINEGATFYFTLPSIEEI